DYAPGKVDWMAHGQPIEGTGASRTTALTLIREDVATCGLDDSAEEVARRIDASLYGFALALSPGRVVLGRVRRSRLADAGAIGGLARARRRGTAGRWTGSATGVTVGRRALAGG